MAGRDDFGSRSGTSSSYKGGAGGLGNGGIGGGMGGGFGGGGAGRVGGIGSRTGLMTGNVMRGGVAQGRPGGPAMNPGAWGVRPSPPTTQGPLPAYAPPPVAGVNPVIENVPLPGTIQNPFYQPSLNNVSGFIQAMKNRYGWGAAMPGPGPMTAPAPVAPTSWRNPTAFPQFASGWKNTTDNYTLGNTYPGGLKYTREPGRDNNWSNDDTRFGIDKLARDRGY